MELIYRYSIKVTVLIGTGNLGSPCESKILVIKPEDELAHFPYSYLKPEETILENGTKQLEKYTGINTAWVKLRLHSILDSTNTKDKQGRRCVNVILSCLLPEITDLVYATWKNIVGISSVLTDEDKEILQYVAVMGGL